MRHGQRIVGGRPHAAQTSSSVLVARRLAVISLNGLGLVVIVGEDLALDRRSGRRVLHGPAGAEGLFVVGEERRSLDGCGEGRRPVGPRRPRVRRRHVDGDVVARRRYGIVDGDDVRRARAAERASRRRRRRRGRDRRVGRSEVRGEPPQRDLAALERPPERHRVCLFVPVFVVGRRRVGLFFFACRIRGWAPLPAEILGSTGAARPVAPSTTPSEEESLSTPVAAATKATALSNASRSSCVAAERLARAARTAGRSASRSSGSAGRARASWECSAAASRHQAWA